MACLRFLLFDNPIVEREELFLRGVGEDSDIVTKEMYTFDDKSGRKLCLRPEFTSSVLRAFLNTKQSLHAVAGFYYNGSAYRYERPQQGRYREFHQFGGEIMNCDHSFHDLEVLSLCYSIIQKLELQGPVSLQINSLGSTECMQQYREVLYNYFKQYENDLSEESQNRFMRGSLLRILDSKQQEDQVILKECPSILPYLSTEDREHFEQLQIDLTSCHIPYTVNPRLVRGLDYYNNLVFEFTTDIGALIGGGSYSHLSKTLGYSRDIHCIGFSAGLERCMTQSTLQPTEKKNRIGIIMMDDAEGGVHQAGIAVAQRLRENSIPTICMRGSLKKVLKEFEGMNIHYAVILGENELISYKKDRLLVKDLVQRQQSEMDVPSFISLVSSQNWIVC